MSDELDAQIEMELKKFADTPDEPGPENTNAQADLNLHSFVISITRLSKLAAKKFKYTSLEITDDDAQELEYALEPVKDHIIKLFEYIAYLPLIVFAVGYAGGIYMEYKDKHPSDSEIPKTDVGPS